MRGTASICLGATELETSENDFDSANGPPLAVAFPCVFPAISTSAYVIYTILTTSNIPLHAKVSRAL